MRGDWERIAFDRASRRARMISGITGKRKFKRSNGEIYGIK
jgi:hypothetical protein